MRNFVSVVLIAQLLFYVSCAPKDQVRDRIEAGMMHIGNGGEPKSLDPHLVTGYIEHRILTTLFEGLVNMDAATMEPLPGVAESWELSNDGTEYTFTLREDAAWSNGDPVTAHDFVYSWRRILTPELAAEYAPILYSLKNAEAYNRGELDDFDQVGVKALSDKQLLVTLRAPTPYFLSLHVHFAWFPVHRATIEEYGEMIQRDTRWIRPGNMVSNGPFALADWVPNDEIVVTKNPNYWDAQSVQLNAITFFPIMDALVEERAFVAGELDLTYKVPLTKVRAYQKNGPDVLTIHPFLATEFLRFNLTKPPLDDLRVREALAMAIDRVTLTERVLQGGELPATHFVPDGMAGYESKIFITYNPKKAQRLLSEAGYPGGKNFPALEVLYDTGNNQRVYCEAIQSMWKETLGIEVGLRNTDPKTWLSSMMALDYDIARSMWGADYVDPSNFLEMFYANSGNNSTGFASAEYEALLRQAALTLEDDARNALYQQAEAILLGEVAIAPVYFQTRPYLKRTEVTGYPPNPIAHIDYRTLGFRD